PDELTIAARVALRELVGQLVVRAMLVKRVFREAAAEELPAEDGRVARLVRALAKHGQMGRPRLVRVLVRAPTEQLQGRQLGHDIVVQLSGNVVGVESGGPPVVSSRAPWGSGPACWA